MLKYFTNLLVCKQCISRHLKASRECAAFMMFTFTVNESESATDYAPILILYIKSICRFNVIIRVA